MNFERIWARLVYFNGGLMEFPSFDAPSGATRAATEALDRRPAPPLITRPTNAAEAARANTRIRPCLGRISASPLCRSNGHSAAGGIVREQATRSEEHTSELQSRENLVCRLLLEKKKKKKSTT